jgi:hypothetical protein
MSMRLLFVLSVCLPLWSASAFAQSEKILIVSGEDVPDKLEEDVSEALEKVGSVMSSSGYAGNLRARKQAPDSEEALTKLAPQMGATLIVVLGVSRNKLDVAFRNGHTGRVIDEESVPARGKRPKLGGPARKKIATAAKRAMSKVGPAPSPSPSPSERSQASTAAPSRPAPATTPTRAPSRPTPPARPVAQPQPQQDEEEEEEGEEEGAEESAEQEVPPEDKSKGGIDDSGIAFLLRVGGGVGQRSILVPTSPTRAGGNQIDSAMSPMLDIGVNLEFAFGSSLLLRIGGDYRTIFGMNVGYTSLTGDATSSLSSHSVVLGASLGYLTNGPGSFAIHGFLGWAYRGMSADAPSLPSTSVMGPAIRPEFHIPLGKVATLRIAPEFILVLGASAEIMEPRAVAGLQSMGFAYGGEVSLDFHISKMLSLGAQFRESRGSVDSGWGTAMVENERYITGRLSLRL